MARSVRYAPLGDCDIGFEVTGSGEIDLLHVPGLLNRIESARGEPAVTRHHWRRAEFGRLIRFDKRGTGLSGPLPAGRTLTFEDRVDEALGVLDAAGASRAAVYATADGAPLGGGPERGGRLAHRLGLDYRVTDPPRRAFAYGST